MQNTKENKISKKYYLIVLGVVVLFAIIGAVYVYQEYITPEKPVYISSSITGVIKQIDGNVIYVETLLANTVDIAVIEVTTTPKTEYNRITHQYDQSAINFLHELEETLAVEEASDLWDSAIVSTEDKIQLEDLFVGSRVDAIGKTNAQDTSKMTAENILTVVEITINEPDEPSDELEYETFYDDL